MTVTDITTAMFTVDIDEDDAAKNRYAHAVIRCQEAVDAVTPEDAHKIKGKLHAVINVVYLATIGETGDTSPTYSDGSPVVRLVRTVGPFPEYQNIVVSEDYESLGELLGEVEVPAGWSLEVADIPRIPAQREKNTELAQHLAGKPEEEGISLQDAAKLLNLPSNFPVIDADRTENDREIGRQVFEDLGHIEPYVPDNDFWATVPLRLSHNQAAGVVLEVGTFDFGAKEIAALKVAISAWESAQ